MIQLSDVNFTVSQIKQLKRKKIMNLEDLLLNFPKEYYNIESYLPENRCKDSIFVSEIIILKSTYVGKGVFIAYGQTKDKRQVHISFFGKSRYNYKFTLNEQYLVFGRAAKYHGELQISSPIYFATYQLGDRIPIYAKYQEIQGISEQTMKKAVSAMIKNISNCDDYLPNEIREEAKLCTRMEAIQGIHFPINERDITRAKRRMMFDILFKFKFQLRYQNRTKQYFEFDFKCREKTKEILTRIPYRLTRTGMRTSSDSLGQFEVLKTISNKLNKKEVLNLLIQGDVGSEKTIVALLTAMLFMENGKKVVIMAPTLILAQQIYQEALEFYKDDAKIIFYAGALTTKEKKKMQKQISDNECDMIIGTHSINNLDIPDLGLMIVDEEHRFGVNQKMTLQMKYSEISYISMSATPIPRTIAQSIYGRNMDILSITTMPKGRKKVKTCIMPYGKNFYETLLHEILKGHQGYIICPLIKENKISDKRSVRAVYQDAQEFFKTYDIRIGVINGAMEEDVIKSELERFKNKEYDVLISTTIVEVGVNVPNATIIGIANAECFGLAQLHQLRGRVGRSTYQSYCFLMTEKESTRLKYLEKSNSGFFLAKKDLELRGVGELFGEEQTGFSLPIEIMLSNEKMDKYIDGILDFIEAENSIEEIQSQLFLE